VKKKLTSLDIRLQFALVVILLVAVGVGGYSFVVAPLGTQTLNLQNQVNAEQTQVVTRRAELKDGQHPPAIQVADIFKLSRAMPDTVDMPGIILTLSNVAQEAGISFDSIEPVLDATPPTGPYQTVRVHLFFSGDFYGLSDFLYRLRSLVTVRGGKLNADGRLFNVGSVSFDVLANSFPQISAELYVDAYQYSGGSGGGSGSGTTTTTPAAPTSTDSTATATTPDSSSTSLPSDASATGAQP
jgi:Tfp pilus assembly protein PilO